MSYRIAERLVIVPVMLRKIRGDVAQVSYLHHWRNTIDSMFDSKRSVVWIHPVVCSTKLKSYVF